MKVIDILNQLEEAGQLKTLYQAGVIGLSAYSQRDIYLRWQTLRASLRYAHDNPGAVRRVADEMDVSVRTVERAISGMQRLVA